MGVVVVPANGALTRTTAARAGGRIAAAEAPMTNRRFNTASAPDPRVLSVVPSITALKPFCGPGRRVGRTDDEKG
jgi:hypothetical protein